MADPKYMRKIQGMRHVIGARTWQEFLDAAYKLGLFQGN